MALTIGQLAASAGVGVETIRYYQRRGLIDTPPRDGTGLNGGVRRYDAAALRRLGFIRTAQAAGFTLAEIAELLDLDALTDRRRARELAEARVAALDRRITELQSARAALQRLASDCGRGGDGPCPIITAFEPG